MSTRPSDIFDELVSRAEEPKVLAGEDVEGLTLIILNLIRRLGDSAFLDAMKSADYRQRSALRVFLNGTELSDKYPKTKKELQNISLDKTWPAVKVTEF